MQRRRHASRGSGRADGQQMTIIVSKCESGNIKVPVIDMDAPVIRDRFMREVVRRNA